MKVQTTAAVLLLLAIGTHAQQDSSVYAPLSNIPAAAEGVETQFWFPDHPSLQFPAGDTVEVLAGIHSGGSESYNVTAIFASLNNPNQFSTYFFNFTPQAYERTVRPGEELSLSYSFYLPYNLPPREFQVAMTVFYTSEKTYYASTFFNKTIDIVEKGKWIDTELLFLVLLLLGAAGGLGYLLYHYISNLGFIRNRKSKRSSKRTVREATPDSSNADEWLKGTNFAQGTRPPRKSVSNKDVRKAQQS